MSNPRITNQTLAPAGTSISNTSLNSSNWQIYVISENNMVTSLTPTQNKRVTVDLAFDIPPNTEIPVPGDISGEYICNDKTVEVRIVVRTNSGGTPDRIVPRRLTFDINLGNTAHEIRYLRFSVVNGTTVEKKKVVSTDPNNHPITQGGSC